MFYQGKSARFQRYNTTRNKKGKCEVSISGSLKQWVSEADLETRDRQMNIESDPALDAAEQSALVRLVGMLKWREPELRFWYRHGGDWARKKVVVASKNGTTGA